MYFTHFWISAAFGFAGAAGRAKKIGKPLKEIIPSIYNNYRIMNTLHNYENFVVKKLRDYTPPYEPYQIFPEWPLEDEIKVYF